MFYYLCGHWLTYRSRFGAKWLKFLIDILPFLVSGIIMFAPIFLIMTAGISVIILGLWPVHCFYTYYCILRSVLKSAPILIIALWCLFWSSCTFILGWSHIHISSHNWTDALCNGSTKQFGPALKLILCICILVILIAWPPIGIACAVLGGAAYGLLAPTFATFQAVEEGKTSKFYHCICVCKSCQSKNIIFPQCLLPLNNIFCFTMLAGRNLEHR